MTRWDDDRNGNVYGVVEWVRRNTLMWFGHIEGMKSEKLEKKVFVSWNCGPSKRKPLGRWKDRVKVYMCERGDNRKRRFEQARRECLDRERSRGSSAMAIPLGDIARGRRESEPSEL